jgi:hypothetical protein
MLHTPFSNFISTLQKQPQFHYINSFFYIINSAPITPISIRSTHTIRSVIILLFTHLNQQFQQTIDFTF